MRTLKLKGDNQITIGDSSILCFKTLCVNNNRSAFSKLLCFVLRILHILIYLVLTIVLWGRQWQLLLEIKKMRFREITLPTHCHIISRGQSLLLTFFFNSKLIPSFLELASFKSSDSWKTQHHVLLYLILYLWPNGGNISMFGNLKAKEYYLLEYTGIQA